MPVSEELLKILICPETRQPLGRVQPEDLARLNERIAAGEIVNRSGTTVKTELAEALIREDGKLVYPVLESIPVLLLEEGFFLNPVQ